MATQAQPSTKPAPAARQKRDSLLNAYAIMLFAWMGDFRAESAGAGIAIQGVFLGLYVLGLLWFVVVYQGTKWKVPGLATLIYCASLYMVVGVYSSIVNGLDAYQTFRNTLGVAVYLIAAVTTAQMVLCTDLVRLRLLLARMALGYAVMTILIVQFYGGGIDINTIRFQIIGASIIAMMAYGPMAVVYDIYTLEKINLIFSYLVIFISTTRTYLVIAAFQIISIYPAFRRLLSVRYILIGIGVLALAASFVAVGSSGIDRWGQRLFQQRDSNGQDYTAYTRISENQFMIDHFLDNVQSFTFGNGISAETDWWDPIELGGGVEHSTGFGHNQFISLLFTAGVMGGFPLLILHLHQAFTALLTSVALSRRRLTEVASHLDVLTFWGALIVISCVVDNFLSSTFGNRGSSLWYGVGTGLLLGGRACARIRAELSAKPQLAVAERG